MVGVHTYMHAYTYTTAVIITSLYYSVHVAALLVTCSLLLTNPDVGQSSDLVTELHVVYCTWDLICVLFTHPKLRTDVPFLKGLFSVLASVGF